jgi:hypothetical protein
MKKQQSRRTARRGSPASRAFHRKSAKLATSEFNDIVTEARIIILPSGEPAE